MQAIQQEHMWWERADLAYRANVLYFNEANLARLAETTGLPTYVYSPRRVHEKLSGLRSALHNAGIEHRIFFAMKANRHPGLLALLASEGVLGADCCSPGEVLLARQSGFAEANISFTGNVVSNADLAVLAKHPEVIINCESISQIRRLAAFSPGRSIGLRVNPGIGVSYRNVERLAYAGNMTTKFGIYREQLEEALEVARSVGLNVVGLHCHSGWGIADCALDAYRDIFEAIKRFTVKVPNLRYLNLGGGLGVPLVEGDAHLDVDRFAAIVADAFASLQVPLYFEPGDYLVKDAGLLLLEVTTIETKRDQTFVYLNGGHNLNVEPAHYGLRHEIVPVMRRSEAPSWKTVTLAGNINENVDIFAANVAMPHLREGDHVALLHSGGYGASMSSNHCMRGTFSEYLV